MSAFIRPVPECECPYCGHQIHTVLDPSPLPLTAGPYAGDLLVCAACFSFTVFDQDGQLRPATAKERRAVLDD